MSSSRISPDVSATAVLEGQIMRGIDGNLWVAVPTRTGVQRWVKYLSATMNGMKVLSVDYIRKNIGRPIMIYEAATSDLWPNKLPRHRYSFTPNGDVRLFNRKRWYKDWLLTEDPAIDYSKTYVEIGGKSNFPLFMTGNGEAATANPRNTQSFIRVSDTE